MKAECEWTNKLHFKTDIDGFNLNMDAKRPLGEENGPTPKSLVLAAACGCTAMDVISLLKKYKQEPSYFKVTGVAESAKTHPAEFTEIKLQYIVNGNCEPEKLIEAVQLSQSKYCAVSAMLSRVTPIKYQITLNESLIAEGQSQFQN